MTLPPKIWLSPPHLGPDEREPPPFLLPLRALLEHPEQLQDGLAVGVEGLFREEDPLLAAVPLYLAVVCIELDFPRKALSENRFHLGGEHGEKLRDEPIRVRPWHRSQQDRIHDGEDRRRRAESDTENEDGGQCERGPCGPATERETKIVPEWPHGFRASYGFWV